MSTVTVKSIMVTTKDINPQVSRRRDLNRACIRFLFRSIWLLLSKKIQSPMLQMIMSEVYLRKNY